MSDACTEPRLAKRRRTKDGCRPCRVRKKKCDGRRPRCVSCERNVLLCSWFSGTTGNVSPESAGGSNENIQEQEQEDQGQRRHSVDVTGSGSGSGEDGAIRVDRSAAPVLVPKDQVMIIGNLRGQPSLEPIFRDPVSVLLYQHWIERTGDVVSAKRGRGNAFVTELPRLAIAYPDTVMQSLLAISGIHYNNGNKSPEVEASTWTHLGLALRSLKYGLTKLVSRSGYDPVPLLTTALVMCFLENTRGDVSGSMSHHLRAAHILFHSAVASHALQMDESILEFLKEFYIYITRITDISYDSERPPCETGSDDDSKDVVPWISSKSHGMLVGCSYELFNMIPHVSAIARRKRERLRKLESKDQMTDEMNRELEHDRASYRAMHSQILAWHPPTDAQQDFITCGAIYQQAVLCYLDISFADPALLAQPQVPPFVQDRFDELNRLLEALPLDANITSTLCWPLALFGSLTKDETQRSIIYTRLQAMWDTLEIGNITTTMKFLERLWRDLRGGEVVLVGSDAAPSSSSSSSSSTTTAAKTNHNKTKNRPVDLTDMEGLMKRYNLLVSFA